MGEKATVADLPGIWDIELRLDDDMSGRVAIGEMKLLMPTDGAKQCPLGESDCEPTVRGTHNIRLEQLLQHDLSTDVRAMIDTDGGIVFMIGGCCDRGEIGARGRLHGSQVIGNWEETFIGTGRTGTFVFTKRP